jgi:hypothetical protein
MAQHMIDEPIEVQFEAAISLLQLEYKTLNMQVIHLHKNPYLDTSTINILKDRRDKICDFLVSIRRL